MPGTTWIRCSALGAVQSSASRSRHNPNDLELVADIKLVYDLGTNSFLTKPFTTAELNELIKSFHHYWIVSNRTPSGN
jgi:hypothetical protein